MTSVRVEDLKGHLLRLAQNGMRMNLSGARGPIGLDLVGDPSDWVGKVPQFTGTGRQVVPVLPGSGADAALRADLLSNTGAYNVKDKLDGVTGADSLTQGDINHAFLTSVWCGTVGDGATDDTAAIQRYLDYCNGFDRAKVAYIVGRCRITASLKLDRLVDHKFSYMRIVGIGEGAGFYRDGDFPLFDSNLTSADIEVPLGADPAMTGAPCTEKISFEGITFESADKTDASGVLSKKFLRVRFLGCDFYRIKAANFSKGSDATGYAQQISFIGGHALDWQGWFLDSWQCYHVAVSSSFEMEAGDHGFRAVAGVFEFSVHQFLCEGCAGHPLWIAGGFNLSASKVYLEGNGAPIVCVDVPDGGSMLGLKLSEIHHKPTDAQIADPDYYPLVLGNSIGTGQSNVALGGNLYDDSDTPHGHFLSIKDSAPYGKLNASGLPISVEISGLCTVETDVVAVGTDAATAHPITTQQIRVVTGTGGLLMPAGNFGEFAGSVRIVNYAPNKITVYAQSGETINGAASFVMPSGSERELWCSPPGKWNTPTFLPYQADLSALTTLPTVIAAFNALNLHLRDAGEQLPS